jgi:hypothetical protein
MGRIVCALTLALAVGLAGAGCGAGAAAGPQDDAALPGHDASVDVAPSADAADAAPDGRPAADGGLDAPPADGVPSDTAPGDGLPGDGAPGDGMVTDGSGPGDAAPGDARPDGGCSQVSLLGNGDFEQGHTVWTEDSTGSFDLIYATADLPTDRPPQGGGWAAWLGGYDAADDLLGQDVAIPAGATTLRLTGYRSVATQETGTYPWDFARVELRSATGAVLETLLTYSNADATTGWQAIQATAQSPHAGTTVRLALHATNDSISNPTDFFFDTLVLEATVCQ